MTKKVLLGLAVVAAVLIVAEIIALLALKHDLSSFAAYWRARAGQTGDFTYVALGDSAAQGIGASSPEKGYVGLVAARLEQATGRKVRVVNLSVSGAKLEDVLHQQLPQLRNYRADLITMEIGANDMRSYQADNFRQQFEQILQALPADRSVVANMPFFGGRVRLGDTPLQASQVIGQLTGQYGIALADLYQPLQAGNGPWIYAADYFHPNDRGYRIWYQAFWKVIEPKLDGLPQTPRPGLSDQPG